MKLFFCFHLSGKSFSIKNLKHQTRRKIYFVIESNKKRLKEKMADGEIFGKKRKLF